jgi:hypothetical protein
MVPLEIIVRNMWHTGPDRRSHCCGARSRSHGRGLVAALSGHCASRGCRGHESPEVENGRLNCPMHTFKGETSADGISDSCAGIFRPGPIWGTR